MSLCEASLTFQATSFQNEQFVQAFKTSILCEASLTFQARSFQNEHFVRGFFNFLSKKLPKSCACHAKCENDISPWKFEAPKRAFRARPPSNSTSMTFAKLPPLSKILTKCCTCHDIWSSVTFARPWQCDLSKKHLRHNTKRCACHDLAKGRITKCCACHEKTTHLDWHAYKYCACHAKRENDLRFCDLGAPKQAFRARLPPLFILWRKGLCRSACVPPNAEKVTTQQRRRHDDDTTNTTRTQVQSQTPTINGNPSLRIRDQDEA